MSADHLVPMGPLTPAVLKLDPLLDPCVSRGPYSPSIRSQSLCRPCRGQPSHSWAGAFGCCTAATVKACFRVIIISSTWSKRRETAASKSNLKWDGLEFHNSVERLSIFRVFWTVSHRLAENHQHNCQDYYSLRNTTQTLRAPEGGKVKRKTTNSIPSEKANFSYRKSKVTFLNCENQRGGCEWAGSLTVVKIKHVHPQGLRCVPTSDSVLMNE